MIDPAKKKPLGLPAFIMLSFCLHVAVLTGQAFIPDMNRKIEPVPPPLFEVSFIEPTEDKNKNIVVDVPPPEIPDQAMTSDLLSNANSRMHSNLEKDHADEYRNNKIVVPKVVSVSSPGVNEQVPVKKKKRAAKPEVEKKEPLPENGEMATPAPTPEPVQDMEKQQREEKSRAPVKSAYALLDGFDMEKYASIDTKSPATNSADDNMPISLDTTETKYASYFARIKRQIERVWSYPAEAAQRGISGELTLRFQISREGNLLGLIIIDKSGSEILDLAAFKAVKDAVPFYPIPSSIDKDKLTILATFVYSPSYTYRKRN